MNIGITISIYNNDNVWANGIFQNAVNLFLLLRNIPNYNVFLLNTSNDDKVEITIDGLNIYNINDKINETDLLFILGSQITNQHQEILKSKNSKIVYYVCGTNYFVDMEQVLFKEKDKSSVKKIIPDEIWIVPQNYETNKYYLETIYKRECKQVPFIWSSTFIDDYIKKTTDDCYYKINDIKNISCFEPNLNTVKYSMYNIIITEMLYNKHPELIKHFYVTNTQSVRTNQTFIDTMKYLNIVNDGKATFENTYVVPHFLSKYTDVVISHQMYNPLNYLYLDALYLNYPLVHNAKLIKDAGYYYAGFDAKTGAEKLNYALTEHDNNIEKYKEKSKRVLNRYLPTNEKSIEVYQNMIQKLMKKHD